MNIYGTLRVAPRHLNFINVLRPGVWRRNKVRPVMAKAPAKHAVHHILWKWARPGQIMTRWPP